MLCLGIETSCDETAVAAVNENGLLGERLATQIDVHAVFGGVVPEIASREHLRVLPALYRDLMKDLDLKPEDIDVVSVARGPGLLGSLLVGMSFAKGLCLATGAKLVGVDHLRAHLLAPALEQEISFPALGLLVSGGHTHIYRMDSPTEFELLGRTLDDAAGEAFDKVAKIMNFPYPGGRFIDELGQGTDPDRKVFPRAYISNDNLDFSFSGLKTAVVNYVQANPELVLPAMADVSTIEAFSDEERERFAYVCSSFNWAVADTLRIKVERALDRQQGVKSLVVAGGVAANSMIRNTMADVARRKKLEMVLPGFSLCTDNGAMIANAGRLMAEAGQFHALDLEAIPRGRKIPEDWIAAQENAELSG